MIDTKEQYERTKAWAATLSKAVADYETERDQWLHPLLLQAGIDAYRSVIEDLQREVAEYDRTHGGQANDQGV